MRDARLFRWFVGVFAGLLLPSAARATVAVPLGLDALVDKAEVIALGHVEATQPRWTRDGGAIVTEVTLRVTRGLKGVRDGQVITLLREGGEVDGVGMLVQGAARFQRGEEVLVFLEGRADATSPAEVQKQLKPENRRRWTVGMTQGKMRVFLAGGRKMALRSTEGLAFVGAPPREPMIRPLDELLAEITQRVQAGGGR